MLLEGRLARQLILALVGMAAGGSIAAGVFAFLAAIGIFPRVIAKTRTRKQIRLYETMLILGGSSGNLLDLHPFSIGVGGTLLLLILGLAIGIFVGCLVMSLAETLQAFPILERRIHMTEGMQWVIVAFAIGKTVGALCYFWQGWGFS
ncbi:MAG: stage V sporulation protein AB [bacterium]|nr:stage V sporulation protein AB [bacterium]